MAKRKLNLMEIGNLYRWNPKKRYNSIPHQYTMFPGDKENIFNLNLTEHFDKSDLITPIERFRGSEHGQENGTRYRIITTSGKIGWISVDDAFIGDWEEVTEPV